MKCKQAEELIPLNAGGDLDDQRARLLHEHLQTCPSCAGAAEAHRESVELTRQCAAPVFSDDVYANVRRQVLQQIENEQDARSWRKLFAGWLQPRPAWAVAALLIVGFGFVALYLLNRNSAPVEPVTEKRPAVNSIQDRSGTAGTVSTSGPKHLPNKGKPEEHRQKTIRRPANQPPLVATKVDAPASSTSVKLSEPDMPNSSPAGDAGQADSPLRVEIQTRDPNIRIIWFAQRENKPAVSNSKGT